MVTIAEEKSASGLRWRKLQGGSGVSPLGASDPVTGLYYERARWYSPSLGTWISQDPLQYINGANTYQFVGGDPVGRVDPWGLSLVGPSAPYFNPNLPKNKASKWHYNVQGTEAYKHYYFVQSLGDLLVPIGNSPNHGILDKTLDDALDGLELLSEVGGAIAAIATETTGFGQGYLAWSGTAYPEVTQTWTRCNRHFPWRLEKTSFGHWQDPQWAQLGNQTITTEGAAEADLGFAKSLIDILEHFKDLFGK